MTSLFCEANYGLVVIRKLENVATTSCTPIFKIREFARPLLNIEIADIFYLTAIVTPMIHDLLFALNGWPGDIFSEKSSSNGQVSIVFNGSQTDLAHLLSNSLGCGDALVQDELCAVATYICRLRRFILSQQTNVDYNSIYKTQLSLALSLFLRDTYQPILAKIEKDYLSSFTGFITPLTLTADICKYTAALKAFSFVLNRVDDGVPVLNAAWAAYSKMDTGVVTPSSKAVESLLLVIVTPFLNQLEEWLSQGYISVDRDPFNEFFIECITIDGSDKRWELRCERLPPFVDLDIANKVMAIGDLRRELTKSRRPSFCLVALLSSRLKSMAGESTDANLSFGDELSSAVASAVVKAHHLANVEMAEHLVSAGALRLISQCCELSFMTRGELFSIWLHSPTVSHILRSSSGESLGKYASVLAGELRIAAQRIYTTARHDSLNASLDSAHFALESISSITSDAIPKFRVFLFPVASIPSGLARVFSDETVQQYKLCFNYLVFLRLASAMLNSTWLNMLTTRRGIKGRHQQKWVISTRAEFAQLARMSRALSALEEHAFHVISSQREEFLRIARDLEVPIENKELTHSSAKHHECDTLILAHAKMISKISYELTRPSQNYQLRTSLVSCVLKATMNNNMTSTSNATSAPTATTTAIVQSDFDKFAPLLSLLLRQQSLVLGSMSISPLQSLLLSMDFNEFYSQQQ